MKCLFKIHKSVKVMVCALTSHFHLFDFAFGLKGHEVKSLPTLTVTAIKVSVTT